MLKIVCLFISLVVLSGCSFVFDSLNNTPAQPRIIVAVLLPLKGSQEKIGNSILNAVHLAYDDAKNSNIILKVYNTSGDIDEDKQVLDQALGDGAKIVIGPIFAQSTASILSTTESANIPVFSFSNDISLLNGTNNLFLASYPLVNDVEKIIDFSHNKHGSQRFAVLAPSNKYGDITVATALASAESRGLEITKIVRYPTNTTAITPQIATLVTEEERLRVAKIKDSLNKGEKVYDDDGNEIIKALLPELDFDALIIGDYGRRLIIVATHLPLVDVDYKAVQILGTSNWNIKDIGREPTLQNSYYPSYPNIQDTEFYSRYKDIYGTEPTALDASAYDATIVVSSLVYKEKDGTLVINPNSNAIYNYHGENGVLGNFIIREDGIFQREMEVIQVFNGRALVVEKSDNYKLYMAVPSFKNLVK